MKHSTNLKVLKPSRKPPERGDVFLMKLPNEEYVFGRVLLSNVPQPRAPMPGANLLYIYDVRSKTSSVLDSELRASRLLLPPLWTNTLGWTKGYFMTVGNRPIDRFDVLRQHYFLRAPVRPGGPAKFLDEKGNELKHRE